MPELKTPEGIQDLCSSASPTNCSTMPPPCQASTTTSVGHPRLSWAHLRKGEVAHIGKNWERQQAVSLVMEHRGSDCYRASAALCSIRLEVAENLHGGTFGSENQLATQTLPMRPVVETQESRQKHFIADHLGCRFVRCPWGLQTPHSITVSMPCIDLAQFRCCMISPSWEGQCDGPGQSLSGSSTAIQTSPQTLTGIVGRVKF